MGTACAQAHGERPHDAASTGWQAMLAREQLATTVIADRDGAFVRSRIANGHVVVERSTDQGRSWFDPVRVNAEPAAIAGDGENRPKLALGRDGVVHVSWTEHTATPYTGRIRYSRSIDGGKSFRGPVTVNDDGLETSHRFDSLIVDGRGHVHIVWLDKRDLVAAEQAGRAYRGAALYHAQSTDGGLSFTPNVRRAHHGCECCRIALALDTDGTPVAFWRHVYRGDIRDHALLRLTDGAQRRRVTRDHWQIQACPHHGPALAIDAGGRRHYAWFNGEPSRAGLYYAHSTDTGRGMSVPVAFGAADRQAGHPSIAVHGARVVLAWKEFDGAQTRIVVMTSSDAGAHWHAPEALAVSASASDHPQLIADGARTWLSWTTAAEGHRLIALDEATSGSAASANTAADHAPARPRAFTSATFATIRTRYARTPLVVGLWSVECSPCLDDFAVLAEARKRHPQLNLVLISTDAPALGPRAAEILGTFGLTGVEHYIFAEDYAERLRYSVDPRWRGELPRTYFFAPGAEPEALSGRLSSEIVSRWMARGKS